MNLIDGKKRLLNLLAVFGTLTAVFLVATLIATWGYSEHLAHTIAIILGCVSAAFGISSGLLGMVLNGMPDREPYTNTTDQDRERNAYLSSVQGFTGVVSGINETLRALMPKMTANIAAANSEGPPSDSNPIALARYRARQLRLDSELSTDDVETIHSLENSAASLERKFRPVAAEVTSDSPSDPVRLANLLKNLDEIADVDPGAARKIASG